MSEQIEINISEEEEKTYLQNIQTKISSAIKSIEFLTNTQYDEIIEQKRYLAESKADMDHVEKVSVRQSIEQMAMIGDHSVAKKLRLLKLINSPYFGRIDFRSNENTNNNPHYIGMHNFTDPETGDNIIYDWRAPLSSMFYDFELGEAHYDAPGGRTAGEISLKRQYRICNRKFEYMLESSLNIHDDILQKELSQASNEKMRNIVATIQRDQNAIIRNDQSTTLIIQGAAGSGKTSIALHRIAFLLYRFKDSINSKDILIISPNKVFGDYISNVLPELGEEKIQETSMEDLASELLDHQYKFQTFFEQVAHLLQKKDKKFRERISFKSSGEFLKKLDEYIRDIKTNNFQPQDIITESYTVPQDFIERRFKAYQTVAPDKRITQMLIGIAEYVNNYCQFEIKGNERNEIRKKIRRMFRTTNIKVLYNNFYKWLGRPEMFRMDNGSVYEYSDVFPLLYLKMALEGTKKYSAVKHLVIDEMQDYTPLQYRVISRLFTCKKTILGDSNQSVNPFSSSSLDTISSVFPNSDCMYMNKSYRSTIEITQFAQQIKRNDRLEPIERHGEKPKILSLLNKDDELNEIKTHIKSFFDSGYKSMGIICKTQLQANGLYEKLNEVSADIYLLNSQSSSFTDGVIITTAHMSKGLEFDQVFVPFCTEDNYRDEVDRQMLYVACTRAMHNLTLTFTANNSQFLNDLIKQEIN